MSFTVAPLYLFFSEFKQSKLNQTSTFQSGPFGPESHEPQWNLELNKQSTWLYALCNFKRHEVQFQVKDLFCFQTVILLQTALVKHCLLGKAFFQVVFHAAPRHCVLVIGVGEMSPSGNDFSATEEGFTGSSTRWKQPTKSSRLISSCCGIKVQPAWSGLRHSFCLLFLFLKVPFCVRPIILTLHVAAHLRMYTPTVPPSLHLCLLLRLSTFTLQCLNE